MAGALLGSLHQRSAIPEHVSPLPMDKVPYILARISQESSNCSGLLWLHSTARDEPSGYHVLNSCF